MPTGYTAALCEREVPFEEFVWGCARAFGAFVGQRDDPADAAPVLKEEPSPYHTNRMKDLERGLATVRARTPEQTAAAHAADLAASEAYYAKVNAQRKAVAARLDAMIAKVEAWVPPTEKHQGLKDFMLQQLRDTREVDGEPHTPPAYLGVEEWHRTQVEALESCLRSTRESMAREAASTGSRNEWKRQLLASVPLPT